MTFWNGLQRFGDAPCIQGETSLSYRQVAEQADALFAGRQRAVALLLCARSSATLLGYLGCLRADIVPVMLPDDTSSSALQVYRERYRPAYIWLPAARREELGLTGAPLLAELYEFQLLACEGQSPGLHDSLALLLTTSGSTGDPKLVRLSGRNLQANADSIGSALNILPQSCPITLLPFHYSFGLSVINSHLNQGCRLVLTGQGLAERGFWDLFRQHAVTSFYGVPYHFEMLKKFRFERMTLPSLTLMAQAGGRMADELKNEFHQLGRLKSFSFVCMYGQTEATARIAILQADQFEARHGSVGCAVPGGEISIDRPDSDGVGEVVYQGPNVSLGYATDAEDLARGDDNLGVLHTGDIGYLDADGFLYLVGRKRRFVKVYGHSINLDHVESLLKEHVPESAVVGRDDCIQVLITQGSPDPVREFLLERVRIQPAALFVRKVEALPYTASGKPDYGSLAARYLPDELTPL